MSKEYVIFYFGLLIAQLCYQSHAQFTNQYEFLSDENEVRMLNVLEKVILYVISHNPSKSEIMAVKTILKTIIEKQIQKQKMLDYWMLRQG